MDIALTLCYLVPGAKYYGSTSANDEAAYDALDWKDERPKPSWQDIVDNTETAELLFWRAGVIVTPLQLIRGLIIIDEYALVESYIAQAGPDVQMSWNRSVEIPRNDQFVGQMLQLLEKSDEEADMLFALALTL